MWTLPDNARGVGLRPCWQIYMEVTTLGETQLEERGNTGYVRDRCSANQSLHICHRFRSLESGRSLHNRLHSGERPLAITSLPVS